MILFDIEFYYFNDIVGGKSTTSVNHASHDPLPIGAPGSYANISS